MYPDCRHCAGERGVIQYLICVKRSEYFRAQPQLPAGKFLPPGVAFGMRGLLLCNRCIVCQLMRRVVAMRNIKNDNCDADSCWRDSPASERPMHSGVRLTGLTTTGMTVHGVIRATVMVVIPATVMAVIPATATAVIPAMAMVVTLATAMADIPVMAMVVTPAMVMVVILATLFRMQHRPLPHRHRPRHRKLTRNNSAVGVLYKRQPSGCRFYLAERQGFEPWEGFPSTVFKTAAFDHSATSPELFIHLSCSAAIKQDWQCLQRRPFLGWIPASAIAPALL